MTRDEGTFTGSAGDPIFWQSWTPEAPAAPKALVVLVHGLHEHSGRYEHVARRLTDAAYAVFAMDHQGHGRSGGAQGNVGSMAGVLTDLDHLRGLAEASVPGVPVFVLGHSMGGLIALDHVTDRGQDGLAGLVLSGAAVDVSSAGGVQMRLAPLIGKVAPNLGVLLLGSENVSRDPAVVTDYENDPLNRNGKVRARTGAEMLLAVQRVVDRLPQVTLPVLVMHGTDDRLVPVQAADLIHDSVGSTDKTLLTYDGLFHEIFNEPEQKQVLDDLVGWLDGHC